MSADQTCRVFGPLLASSDGRPFPCWKELSRPQIHGYDINAVALGMDQTAHRCVLYSGADEKVIRVLEAPLGVDVGIQRLCGASLANIGAMDDGDKAGR